MSQIDDVYWHYIWKEGLPTKHGRYLVQGGDGDIAIQSLSYLVRDHDPDENRDGKPYSYAWAELPEGLKKP